MTTSPERLTLALADRYRIERELGVGGMATVYLAQDLKHDRRVAIKVLKPELAAVLGAERFVVEIKTTAALQHPHILPLFDSGSADGFLFFVMPYVEGETLRTRLDRETQLGIDEAVRIARDVADALDYAHRHGVIHRDIKPENILLHDGRPMVVDFGIALALSAAAGGRMTETGLSLGTPHYMSPEQASADKAITGRSDVYSLASVLYEMLTGHPPHAGASAQQLIMKIVTEPAESVTKVRKSVPPNVAAAVAKALEKVPADRFASAKAFADALVDSTFAAAGTPNSARGGRRDARGVSMRVFGTTAIVAVLALVGALWGWVRPAPPTEVLRLNVGLPDSAALAQMDGAVHGYRLALSRDGRKLVYVGRRVAGGRTQLFLRRMDQLAAIPLSGTEDAINPAFSPDGERIAFIAGSPHALRVMSLSGGSLITLTDSLVDPGGVSWSSNGYIYYDGKLTGDGLARIRETGGRPETATMPDTAAGEVWHMAPSALPNGRGVLFTIKRTRDDGLYDIAVLDTRTGKHRVLVRASYARYADSGHLLYVTQDGTLMAVRFDAERLTTSGEAVAMTQGMALQGLWRYADLDISARGLLAYAAGARRVQTRELVWVSRDGAASVVDSTWGRNFVGRPTLSPDGHSAVVAVADGANPQVWVKQLDRGPASKIADNGTSPSWSPDGRSVVFDRTGQLWQGRADGSVLPVRHVGVLQFPAYSPDGQWFIGLLYNDILGIRTTGDSTPIVLVGGANSKGEASVSPDGHWLAYQSAENGRPQIYVSPFPDTKAAKHQVSVDGGASVRWSRDGRELFFIDAQNDLIAVPVTLSPTFSSRLAHRLFSYTPYGTEGNLFDVSADGRHFLTSRSVGHGDAETADRLVVVQNFFEELRARVKR